jgi:YYY domain-containing protein
MTAGGEKFMELAFLNGFKRSAEMPPLDPWLSGYAISYYYFGYVMMSLFIRVSGAAPAVGFNIGGALLFALTVAGAYSLVYNLVGSVRGRHCRAERGAIVHKDQENEGDTGARSPSVPHGNRVWIALLGVLFVVFLSNLEGPLEVAYWGGAGNDGFWQWLDIAELDQPRISMPDGATPSRLTRPGWWWWRASRVIFDYDVQDWFRRDDETASPRPQRRENIDEFPFFSFLLGDMHPHVLALPFVFLALSVSLTLFQLGRDHAADFPMNTLRGAQGQNLRLLFFALIFGALGFLNTWDFPIQWAVGVGAFGLARASGAAQRQPDGAVATGSLSLWQRVRPALNLAIVLGAGGLLLYLPFYLSFQSQAGGPLVHVHSSTRVVQFGIMFGPLLFVLISFLAWGVRRATQNKHKVKVPGATRNPPLLKTAVWTGTGLLALALLIILLTAAAILVSQDIQRLVAPGLADQPASDVAVRYLAMRVGNPWVTLLLVGMIAVAVALLRAPGFNRAVRFSLLLVAAGAVMTLSPEYVYLKDVFGVRINTIFKFYFQGWILWAVAASGAVFALLFSEEGLRGGARWLFALSLTVVVGLGLVYPVLAIPDRVTEFPEAPTLDGTAYLARDNPADYAAIEWLNAQVEGAPVILEKPGGAYQYEGRVSALTGLPTLLGWAGHERQWRGNTLEQDRRIRAIEELCTSTDPQTSLTLLDDYDITYVYLGPLERASCDASALQTLESLLEVVYDRDGVTIYRRVTGLGVRPEALGDRVGE